MNIFNIDLSSDTPELISFKLGMMIDMTALHYDTSLNDLDLYSRSQGYEEAGTFAIILLYLMGADYVRERGANKHWKYKEYELFEHFLFLLADRVPHS